jgi:hypothetical protein
MEFDNCLLLRVGQPVIAGNLCIVLISFSVAACPLVECTAMDFSPGEQIAKGNFSFLGPGANGINNLIAYIMGNPALF